MSLKMLKKSFSYIEVEGIDQKYIDACLLLNLDTAQILSAISDEKNIIAKAKLNKSKILMKKVDRLKLIAGIAPYIRDSYNLYNFLAQMNMATIEAFEKRMKEEADVLTEEEWKQFLKDAILEDEFPYYMYINWLRFNEDHADIKYVFETYGHQFMKDSGLNLTDDFEIAEEVEESSEVEEEFDSLIQGLLSLKTKVGVESFKFKYEEAEKERVLLSEELKSLQAQLKKANDKLKSKEQQLVSKEKTYNQLKKSLDAEKKAREQKNDR